MNKDEIKLIMRWGKTEYLIQELLRNKIFDNLSKHNLYFDHLDEDVLKKLEDIRYKFLKIQDQLHEIINSIVPPEEDDY